jgi:hypothetical protein
MVNIEKLTRKRLGELLLEEGLLNEQQIQEALQYQKENGSLMGEILVKLKYVSEIDIARTISKQFGLPYIDASKYAIDKDAISIVPSRLMYDHQFIVLDKIGKALIIAASGLLDREVFVELERVWGSQIFIYVSTVSQVREALEKYCPIKDQKEHK